ncbi:MAG TPA: hypothetical protein VMT74_05980 [Gaiellaceae bacterium]|nr:hypothetical protein [Gaiellaceae bacterium]
MADENMVAYTAVYSDKEDALADLKALDELHKEKVLGKYDAAVIDQEDGKPHIVKRADKPDYRVVPELFGGGTLPRKELHEAAAELTEGEAGLIVIGEPTVEKAFDQAVTHAVKTAKHDMDATADELIAAFKD